jgi:galactose oxidase
VLSSGSGEGGGVLYENSDFTAQVFTPPYLFNPDGTLAARPRITSAPTRVSYSQSFTVEIPEGGSVTRGTLVRLSSVTHAFNQSQLIYPLTFSVTARRVSPPRARAAPTWRPRGRTCCFS